MVYLVIIFADFLFVNIVNLASCKGKYPQYEEIPYLVVNLVGVTLSIWLAIFGYQHMKTEENRNGRINQDIMPDSQQYRNPMPTMWKCIVINILSQVVGLARTIYFIADPSMDCRFS